MNSGISRLDPQVRDPIAPQLQSLDPMERRVIAVMPLAFRTEHGCGFVPGSQASALNVAFQLARLEIERTLSAQDPTLKPWFAEQGRLWPWLLKRGVGPEVLKENLNFAREKVRLALLLDHKPAADITDLWTELVAYETPVLSTIISSLDDLDVHILFIFERDERTLSRQSEIARTYPSRSSFYEILEFSKKSSLVFLHHHS